MRQPNFIVRLLCLGVLISFVNPLLLFASPDAYNPAKVVYDLSSADPAKLGNILDRVSLLQKIYNNDSFEASIIVVVHEGAIPLFKINAQEELMRRARSLSVGEIIKFKVCKASARMQKIAEKQLRNFVSMVPMADAEIIKLQQAGYAYLR